MRKGIMIAGGIIVAAAGIGIWLLSNQPIDPQQTGTTDISSGETLSIETGALSTDDAQSRPDSLRTKTPQSLLPSKPDLSSAESQRPALASSQNKPQIHPQPVGYDAFGLQPEDYDEQLWEKFEWISYKKTDWDRDKLAYIFEHQQELNNVELLEIASFFRMCAYMPRSHTGLDRNLDGKTNQEWIRSYKLRFDQCFQLPGSRDDLKEISLAWLRLAAERGNVVAQLNYNWAGDAIVFQPEFMLSEGGRERIESFNADVIRFSLMALESGHFEALENLVFHNISGQYGKSDLVLAYAAHVMFAEAFPEKSIAFGLPLNGFTALLSEAELAQGEQMAAQWLAKQGY